MNEKPFHILIVDDEEAARYGIRRALDKFKYVVTEAASVTEAREQVKTAAPDLLILDVNLPGMSGLEYLTELRETNAETAPLVVIITAHGNERTAVEAIKIGAHDYLAKPFEVEDLRLVVKNALETRRLRIENSLLRRQLASEGSGAKFFLGQSDSMLRVRTLIEKVAETEASVLIQGESGTGKELVARAIHESSTHRRTGAFVAVNCAALPAELIESELFGHEKGAFTGAAARRQGKFEQANGGTLFLDEIGDMSLNVQRNFCVRLKRDASNDLAAANPYTLMCVF
jgi:DNA-binding NtrC family response regulator